MAIAYQYDINGFYAGAAEDYGLLPNNATHTAPELREGFIPRWTGESWEQVENHMGSRAGSMTSPILSLSTARTLPAISHKRNMKPNNLPSTTASRRALAACGKNATPALPPRTI